MSSNQVCYGIMGIRRRLSIFFKERFVEGVIKTMKGVNEINRLQYKLIRKPIYNSGICITYEQLGKISESLGMNPGVLISIVNIKEGSIKMLESQFQGILSNGLPNNHNQHWELFTKNINRKAIGENSGNNSNSNNNNGNTIIGSNANRSNANRRRWAAPRINRVRITSTSNNRTGNHRRPQSANMRVAITRNRKRPSSAGS